MSNEKLIQFIKGSALKQGEFTLSSGRKSSYYLDLKLAYTRPEVMAEIVAGIKELIKDEEFDRVAGMELGAVPIAVALSLGTGLPFVIIRKSRKGYGAGRRVEGEINPGDRVLLVEDVATTGASLVSAVEAVRESGGVCAHAVAVVDRGEGGAENLQKINISLTSLLSMEDLGL